MSTPSTKTKFFRIALEGATTDGRVIERAWLEQMAAAYDRKVYGARINLEHFRGIDPAGLFKAYGDVLALETREEDDGKLGLYAQIEPTAELIALNKAKQKIYTSCEINPSFGDTGKAYLVGLAVTDNPASMGTEILAFAAQNPAASPFAAKKLAPGNLFTAATDAVIDLEKPSVANVLLSKVADMLGKSKAQDDTKFNDVTQAVELLASHAKERDAEIAQQFAALRADQQKTNDQVATLVAKLSATPSGDPQRPPAAGGDGSTITTDC